MASRMGSARAHYTGARNYWVAVGSPTSWAVAQGRVSRSRWALARQYTEGSRNQGVALDKEAPRLDYQHHRGKGLGLGTPHCSVDHLYYCRDRSQGHHPGQRSWV